MKPTDPAPAPADLSLRDLATVGRHLEYLDAYLTLGFMQNGASEAAMEYLRELRGDIENRFYAVAREAEGRVPASEDEANARADLLVRKAVYVEEDYSVIASIARDTDDAVRRLRR